MSSSQFGVQPSRLGSINLAADADALFLKVFSGEVLQVFEESNVMMPLVQQRTISSGKTAQFPVVGTATAKYHTPGESVMHQNVTNTISGNQGSEALAQTAANKYLSRIKHAERTISIDGVLLSSAFIADIDEAKNHYDVRAAYTTQIGRELAYTADRALIRTVIAGARATTDRFGGSDAKFLGAAINTTGGDTAYTADELVEGIASIAQKMDEASVPAEGRYVMLNPAHYYLLVKSGNNAINTDFGCMGSIATGEIAQVAGVRILKSNHIPSANESSSQDAVLGDDLINNDLFGSNTGYSGANFSTTVGIGFQTEAVGTVKLMDLAVESEYQMDRLGTLMLAKYAMGHGILREECCFEIKTA